MAVVEEVRTGGLKDNDRGGCWVVENDLIMSGTLLVPLLAANHGQAGGGSDWGQVWVATNNKTEEVKGGSC